MTKVGESKPELNIEIKTLPQTEFFVGESFKYSDAEIYFIIENRQPQKIDNQIVTYSGYDNTKLGKQTITVKLSGVTTTYEITVTDKDAPYAIDNEEDNTVKYMLVCKDCIDGHINIAIIVTVYPTRWKVNFAQFEHDDETHKTDYLYMQEVGQPENIANAFWTYRDGYLYEQHKKVEAEERAKREAEEKANSLAIKEQPKPVKQSWLKRLFKKLKNQN